jgi:NADH:ubiquinone oxidoreductase subunit 2 (subunit N)
MPKITLIFLCYRLLMNMISGLYLYLFSIILILAIFSIFVGTLLALYQTKIKRLLAYSAVSHMGFILLSILIGSEMGFLCSFIYLFIYLLISINIFSIIISIRKYLYKIELKNLVEFVSLFQSNFILSFFLVLCLLSIAGIPPFAGFFGKFYLFFLLTSSGQYLVALYVVLFSVLSCVYYIRLIRFI